MTFDSVTLTLN